MTLEDVVAVLGLMATPHGDAPSTQLPALITALPADTYLSPQHLSRILELLDADCAAAQAGSYLLLARLATHHVAARRLLACGAVDEVLFALQYEPDPHVQAAALTALAALAEAQLAVGQSAEWAERAAPLVHALCESTHAEVVGAAFGAGAALVHVAAVRDWLGLALLAVAKQDIVDAAAAAQDGQLRFLWAAARMQHEPFTAAMLRLDMLAEQVPFLRHEACTFITLVRRHAIARPISPQTGNTGACGAVRGGGGEGAAGAGRDCTGHCGCRAAPVLLAHPVPTAHNHAARDISCRDASACCLAQLVVPQPGDAASHTMAVLRAGKMDVIAQHCAAALRTGSADACRHVAAIVSQITSMCLLKSGKVCAVQFAAPVTPRRGQRARAATRLPWERRRCWSRLACWRRWRERLAGSGPRRCCRCTRRRTSWRHWGGGPCSSDQTSWRRPWLTGSTAAPPPSARRCTLWPCCWTAAPSSPPRARQDWLRCSLPATPTHSAFAFAWLQRRLPSCSAPTSQMRLRNCCGGRTRCWTWCVMRWSCCGCCSGTGARRRCDGADVSSLRLVWRGTWTRACTREPSPCWPTCARRRHPQAQRSMLWRRSGGGATRCALCCGTGGSESLCGGVGTALQASSASGFKYYPAAMS